MCGNVIRNIKSAMQQKTSNSRGVATSPVNILSKYEIIKIITRLKVTNRYDYLDYKEIESVIKKYLE